MLSHGLQIGTFPGCQGPLTCSRFADGGVLLEPKKPSLSLILPQINEVVSEIDR